MYLAPASGHSIEHTIVFTTTSMSYKNYYNINIWSPNIKCRECGIKAIRRERDVYDTLSDLNGSCSIVAVICRHINSHCGLVRESL